MLPKESRNTVIRLGLHLSKLKFFFATGISRLPPLQYIKLLKMCLFRHRVRFFYLVVKFSR